MLEKIQVLTIYALFGLLIALWPIFIRFMPAIYEAPRGFAKFLSVNSVLAALFGLFFTATEVAPQFCTVV